MDSNDFTRLGSLCVTIIHKMGYVILQIQQNQILSPLVFSSLLSRAWCTQYHTAPWHSPTRRCLGYIYLKRKSPPLSTAGAWQPHLPALTRGLLHCLGAGAAAEAQQSKAAAGLQHTQSSPVLFPFLSNCRMHSCSVRKQDVNPSLWAEEWIWFSNKHFDIHIFATTT